MGLKNTQTPGGCGDALQVLTGQVWGPGNVWRAGSTLKGQPVETAHLTLESMGNSVNLGG